jgi:hypothetical protein
MALGKYTRVDNRRSSSSYCSTVSIVIFVGLCLVGVWMMTSSSVVPVQNVDAPQENKNEVKGGVSEKDLGNTPQFEDNPGDLPEDATKGDINVNSESNSNSQKVQDEEKPERSRRKSLKRSRRKSLKRSQRKSLKRSQRKSLKRSQRKSLIQMTIQSQMMDRILKQKMEKEKQILRKLKQISRKLKQIRKKQIQMAGRQKRMVVRKVLMDKVILKRALMRKNLTWMRANRNLIQMRVRRNQRTLIKQRKKKRWMVR